mmetsp:Transcript_36850/g.103991  ORF Transcript_36850/g.103991 Transcript_36850/m.103991 type:complete len:107 (-) Transcript_36850:1379-1699(-)
MRITLPRIYVCMGSCCLEAEQLQIAGVPTCSNLRYTSSAPLHAQACPWPLDGRSHRLTVCCRILNPSDFLWQQNSLSKALQHVLQRVPLAVAGDRGAAILQIAQIK